MEQARLRRAAGSFEPALVDGSEAARSGEGGRRPGLAETEGDYRGGSGGDGRGFGGGGRDLGDCGRGGDGLLDLARLDGPVAGHESGEAGQHRGEDEQKLHA